MRGKRDAAFSVNKLTEAPANINFPRISCARRDHRRVYWPPISRNAAEWPLWLCAIAISFYISNRGSNCIKLSPIKSVMATMMRREAGKSSGLPNVRVCVVSHESTTLATSSDMEGVRGQCKVLSPESVGVANIFHRIVWPRMASKR